jgi:hypothetical protein
MDHVGARSFALVGGAQHVHRDKGRHQPPPGCAQTHLRQTPSFNSKQPRILREKVGIGERLSL